MIGIGDYPGIIGSLSNSLQNRQKQWAEEAEARKAAEPDPEMPPGHKQMPDKERLDTLSKLQSSKMLALKLDYIIIRFY